MPPTPLLDRLLAEYAEAARAILPWSLNIADCWFLASAFGAGSDEVSLRRVEMLDGTLTDEPCASASVYDIDGADREAGDFELALVAPTARAFCYWDQGSGSSCWPAASSSSRLRARTRRRSRSIASSRLPGRWRGCLMRSFVSSTKR